MTRLAEAVVLAAGRGARIRLLTQDGPKALLPILGKPLILHQLELLVASGIRDIAIVTSEHTREIRSRLGSGEDLGARLVWVHDPAPAGISASLERVEGLVASRFLVLLGDSYFVPAGFPRGLDAWPRGSSCVLVVRPDTPEAVSDACAVVLRPDGRVEQVVEKPQAPTTRLKGCGIYLFDGGIFDVLRRTAPSPQFGNEREISVTVQMLIDEGRDVLAVQPLAWDINVNRPEDLLLGNLGALDVLGAPFHVAPGAAVSSGARLERSVVGGGASVGDGVHLVDCLVLDGAQVPAGAGRFRGRIFGPHGIWPPADAPASATRPVAHREGCP